MSSILLFRIDRYVECSCALLAHSSGSATPGHGKVQVVIAYDMRNGPTLGQDTCFLHVKHLFGTLIYILICNEIHYVKVSN